MLRSVRLLVATAALVSMTVTVEAAKVRRLPLSEVRDRARSIVVGEVASMSTRVGEEGRMVWTDYQFRIAESMRGKEVPGQLMTLSFAGGQAGGLDIGVSGVPKLEMGKRYLFFVSDEDALPVPTIGWGQGLYSIETLADGRSEVLLSADGEPLQVTAAGELGRGGRVIVKNGALVAMEPSKKLARPRVFNADGSTRAAAPRQAVAARRTRLANLTDVRAFANGRMREARGPVKQ